MNTPINISDLEYILEYTPHNQNIMLSGKHGIGKSEIITEFYTKKGFKVVPLFVGQMSDPGDIIGLPNKNETTGQTEFMLPYWFPTDNTPIVLFLDELNRARPEILQVVMDLVLNKKIAGKKLPEGSVIVSAINEGGEYTLTDLDPALISRFNIYTFEPTTSEWCIWGRQNGLNNYVLDFISVEPKYLDFSYDDGDDISVKSYDRRSWKRVSDILNKVEYRGEPSLKKLICGIVGNKAGVKFCQYVMSDNMLSAESVLLGDFEKIEDILVHYNLVQQSSMIDKICYYIHANNIRKDTTLRDKCIFNFSKYLDFLEHHSRESIGYLASNYTSMTYNNMNLLLLSAPEISERLNNYISNIQLK